MPAELSPFTAPTWSKRVNRPFENIRSLVVDEPGDLWFGGQEGTFRYDGKTFTNFSATPSPPTPDPDGVEVYAGIYDSSQGWMVVRDKESVVTAQIEGQDAFGLIKTSGHSFKLDDSDIRAMVQFAMKDERATSLSITQNGATTQWTRR